MFRSSGRGHRRAQPLKLRALLGRHAVQRVCGDVAGRRLRRVRHAQQHVGVLLLVHGRDPVVTSRSLLVMHRMLFTGLTLQHVLQHNCMRLHTSTAAS
jgi:hypothetical protein